MYSFSFDFRSSSLVIEEIADGLLSVCKYCKYLAYQFVNIVNIWDILFENKTV